MKPAWDKLMAEFEGNKDALVADVDCTTDGGKAVCSDHGVQGYPTIKWGDPSNLEDYEGGRTFDDLLKFAEENLKPVCSPANLALCDDDKKALIEGFMAMSTEDLDAAIAEKEDGIKEANGKFDESLKTLQANYEKLVSEKDSVVADIKKSGLGLMKAVKAAK